MIKRYIVLLACLLIAVSACEAQTPDGDPVVSGPGSPGPSTVPSPEPSPSPAPQEELPPGVIEPPSWLGKRVLPLAPNGLGIATRTPKILRNRRLATRDILPPPDSRRFTFEISALKGPVLKKSTWKPACPVTRDQLSYVRLSFWGFDRKPHLGELIVNRSVARDVVSVFRSLHRARFPIEEMRLTRAPELNAPPTGDGNNTGAFVCRPARLSDDWSEHAYGLAIDINPFHNPYVNDETVLPERAIAYRSRSWKRPGMILPGGVVTRAFARIGWGWGGNWSSSKDWMHFSRSGG